MILVKTKIKSETFRTIKNFYKRAVVVDGEGGNGERCLHWGGGGHRRS